MSHKNMTFLEKHRIIYARYPVNDQPTTVYDWGWFYEQGTHEFYSLFHPKSLITSYKSLKWHMYVLKYLNPDISKSMFKRLMTHLIDKKNGFIKFQVREKTIDYLIDEVIDHEFKIAPKNRIKKVIFKDTCNLTVSEKLSITGSLIGRNKNADTTAIYDIMLYIHDTGQKITINKLASSLNVSTRTIHRNMGEELKKEKLRLNEELQRTKLRSV
jgi:hypothetical protein